MRFALVAEPWWVNCALLVPLGAYLCWRRSSIAITLRQLIIVAVFASAFGFLEATVVVFLWAFSIWDIAYYASLWATIGWPQSIKDGDVLFLIPEPWFAPVWFPLMVSALTALTVLLARTGPHPKIQEQ